MLVAALNCIFDKGSVPAEFNLSLVTPIYKRGNRRDTASYRAIAVGEPVLWLYASIFNERLLDYTEEHGLRAPTQAGFRPGLSVVHQLFSLQHLTERQRQRRQRLYVCFLDLQGAFDRVPRQVLWQALQRLGLHGAMLAGISSLYSTAAIAIRLRFKAAGGLPCLLILVLNKAARSAPRSLVCLRMDFTAACKLLLLTVGCRLILDSASLILPMLMTSHWSQGHQQGYSTSSLRQWSGVQRWGCGPARTRQLSWR